MIDARELDRPATEITLWGRTLHVRPLRALDLLELAETLEQDRDAFQQHDFYVDLLSKHVDETVDWSECRLDTLRDAGEQVLTALLEKKTTRRTIGQRLTSAFVWVFRIPTIFRRSSSGSGSNTSETIRVSAARSTT